MRISDYWYEYGGGATVDAGNLTGTTLASGVVTTSATTVGALNSGSITSGFGNIDIGSSDFDTSGTVTCDVTGDVSGSSGSCTGNSATATTATTATNVTLTNEATDTTCFPLFVDTATGDQDAKTNTTLTFNSNTATLATTTFSGALSGNATTASNATLAAGLSAQLVVASGGTNLTSYAVGDIVYASGTTTLAKLNVGSNTNVLTLAGGVPTWAAAASGSDTPWSEVHDFDTWYYDMEIQSKPADPSADNARFYVKEVDSDNDGLFCLIRKNGAFEETQIV
jgi:hypothetical protein